MNDTYLMVNGKKIELTAEQKKQLGIEEKSCFDRVTDVRYYYINCEGKVYSTTDTQCSMDKNSHSVANYCTDKDLIYQRSLHETLNRLLWRYSMTHDGDKIVWKKDNSFSTTKWRIYKEHYEPYRKFTNSSFQIRASYTAQSEGAIYFYSEQVARDAIEEIVKPFMKEHPDFVW